MRKPITDFPGYEADTDGNIWSFRADKGKREIKLKQTQGSRWKVSLCRGGKTFNRKVHLLVIRTFKGVAPCGLVTRHIDGNPLNNKLENLCYGTPKENSQDMILHGRSQRGEKNVRTKFTEKDIFEMRSLKENFNLSCAVLAKKFNSNRITIQAIIARRSWKYI